MQISQITIRDPKQTTQLLPHFGSVYTYEVQGTTDGIAHYLVEIGRLDKFLTKALSKDDFTLGRRRIIVQNIGKHFKTNISYWDVDLPENYKDVNWIAKWVCQDIVPKDDEVTDDTQAIQHMLTRMTNLEAQVDSIAKHLFGE